jgi:hypothetical protein
MMKAGEIEFVKVGASTLILVASLRYRAVPIETRILAGLRRPLVGNNHESVRSDPRMSQYIRAVLVQSVARKD